MTKFGESVSHPGELFLTWLSHLQEGTMNYLIQKLNWFAETEGYELSDREIKRVISLYEAHGFISIDWDSRKWQLGDCSIIRMPNSDGIAYVAGPRTESITKEIIQTFGGELLIRDNCYLDHFLPNILVFSYDNIDEVAEFSNKADIDIIVDPEELIQEIEILNELIRVSVTLPSDSDLEFLVVTKANGIKTIKTSVHDAVKLGGLHKYLAFGPADYFWIESGEWYRVDKRYGIHRSATIHSAEIAHWEQNMMNDSLIGSVSISKYMPYPSQVERILVMLSGSSPEIRDEIYLYKNVPYRIWERINSLFSADLIKGAECEK